MYFKRVLIANRGEVAVRIIRACRELGIETVVAYSDADAESVAVRMADHAVRIGPPSPAESYLRGERMVQAALESGCDALHPGFGFLSENADFAAQVQAAGITFVGPNPDAIRTMGLKTAALARVQAAHVPTLPGFDPGTAQDFQAYQHAATQIGYPVLVKAAAGGGGKGMRIVRAESDLQSALESARREAEKAFADGRVFLEKYIDDARHIEFQIFADQQGNTLHFFERECSVQRRHQKIIEESPSPFLTPDQRPQMGTAAVNAARAVGYVNAGTVEFIVDARTSQFYFLEMNTRLQVEHPVTEQVTGLDLVHLQFKIAAGEALSMTQEYIDQQIRQRGHAIECRIYAEDPANGFLPSTGQLLRYIEPHGPGVRVDSGVETGSAITIHYDPMIAKLIVHAPTRADAIRRMDAALAQYVILGVTTNIPFLRAVLAHPAFQAGETTTALLERHFSDWRPAEVETPDSGFIAAALAELIPALGVNGQNAALPEADSARDSDRFSPWARADRFRIGGA